MEETAIRRRLDVIILLLLVHLYIISGIPIMYLFPFAVALLVILVVVGLDNALTATEQS